MCFAIRSVNFPSVQFLLVACGVPVVFGKRPCKIVFPIERFLGTHVQVVMVRIIQDCIHGAACGYAYRSRRQPFVFVGVIRRVRLDMFQQHAVQREVVQREPDGRAGLQGHSYS